MRVNEIFYSLQGEGRWTGTPAVFLRLSGCNLQCSFCDTQHQRFTEMTEEQIVDEACRYPARTMVVTGGEPTLQLNERLCQLLHKQGFRIHLETNGTLPLKAGAEVDWVTCSPKTTEEPLQIERIDELKALFWGQDVSPLLKIPAGEYRLQPLDTGDEERNKEITNQTVEYILNNPTWKLSLQTHKILNVR